MSKLLRRAKVMLDHAKTDYTKVNEDDAYLDSCCYSLQQCIEFTLKYLVELSGERYVENHDIRAQLNKLTDAVPYTKELRQMACTLNSWEAETRYKDSFFAIIEDVDAACTIAEALVNFAEAQTQSTESKPMSTFPDKRA